MKKLSREQLGLIVAGLMVVPHAISMISYVSPTLDRKSDA